MIHDLGMVSEICDEVLAMYRGKTAEYASVDIIYKEALYLHIQRPLQAFPDVASPALRLTPISDYLLPLDAFPPGCCSEPPYHNREALDGVGSL